MAGGLGGERETPLPKPKNPPELLRAAKNDTIKPMVQIIGKEDKKYYKWEECGLLYANKEIAETCQAWCSEHKSCNLEIIKFAVKEPDSN